MEISTITEEKKNDDISAPEKHSPSVFMSKTLLVAKYSWSDNCAESILSQADI